VAVVFVATGGQLPQPTQQTENSFRILLGKLLDGKGCQPRPEGKRTKDSTGAHGNYDRKKAAKVLPTSDFQ